MFPLSYLGLSLFGAGFFPSAGGAPSGAAGPFFPVRYFPLGAFAVGYFPEMVTVVTSGGIGRLTIVTGSGRGDSLGKAGVYDGLSKSGGKG